MNILVLLMPRILLIIIIYFMSYLSFYISRKNRYSFIIPYVSILWFAVLVHYDGLWDYLFPASHPWATDIATLFIGSILLSIAFFITELIRLLFFHKKKQIRTKSNWLQNILISFFPVLLLISYLYYIVFGFIDIPLPLFWGLMLIDKVLILKYEYYFRQTALKVVLISFFLSYGTYRIIGETIIVASDCLVGYVLLQAKRDIPLKNFLKMAVSKFL